MKRIAVIDGERTLWAKVDDEDAPNLQGTTWRAHRAPRSRTIYARGYHSGKRVLMHRAILGDKAGPVTDHIDGNGLNNQRANLRSVTQEMNMKFHHGRKAFDRFEDLL